MSQANFLNSQKQSTTEKLSGKRNKLYLYGKYIKYDIIIDSGGSHHMTGDINFLTHISTIQAFLISLPNGNIITWAIKHDNLYLGQRLVITNVCPTPIHYFIYVAQLLRDIACFVFFIKRFCVIHDLASGF